MRAAYYLRISTEAQDLDNQRGEIMPFIERRGWQLVHPFEDVMSGRKTEKDRPGFAAMLAAAHQRKFDIVVFWALDRLTREGTRATLPVFILSAALRHSSPVFHRSCHTGLSGAAMNFCMPGLTSVGTGIDFAGTSRGASAASSAFKKGEIKSWNR